MLKKRTMFSDEDLIHLAERFKLLSESSRLRILHCLFEREKCVSEIINDTGLMQANVSKQLRILQEHGILTCRPDGLKRFYTVSDDTIFEICRLLCIRKN